MSVDRRPPRYSNFQDYARAQGLVPETPSVMDTRRDFYTLPVLERLKRCDSRAGRRLSDNERRERLATTITDALRMDPAARAEQDIRLVLIGPRSIEKTLIERDPEPVGASVFAVFPGGERKRFLATSDEVLKEYEEVERGELVAGVDAFYAETTAERVQRMVMNIKQWDAEIAVQKNHSERRHPTSSLSLKDQITFVRSTAEMDRLNGLKSQAIADFLADALDVEARYPRLKPIFVIEDIPHSRKRHQRLRMWQPRLSNIFTRLSNRKVPEGVIDGISEAQTTISIIALQEKLASIQEGGQVPAHLQASYDILRVLQRDDIAHRVRV